MASTNVLGITGSLAIILAVSGAVACGSGNNAPASSAAGAGAGAQVASAPAGTQEGDDEAGDKLVEHHRHHHGGIAMFLHMSLDSLGVSDEQRAAVTKIQEDLAAKLEPEHAAQGNVLSLLADGVAAGQVDKAKVDAAIAQVETSADAAQAATADALNQLHATLTPPQRIALVQKLEAHWQVWQRANSEGETAAPHDRFAGLTRDLGLTPDEVSRIRASLHASAGGDGPKKLDPAEVEGKMKGFGTAFEGDAFDAKTVNSGAGVNVHLASHGVRRMARFYEAAAPVLTPDQRTKLSAKLREHAGQEAGK